MFTVTNLDKAGSHYLIFEKFDLLIDHLLEVEHTIFAAFTFVVIINTFLINFKITY